ncbi:MAG: 50S ribosomal protein P1 [Candidatus Thermoplasmatota archaeon]|nr:50S ribosomal protein P1 [Candidatus Thermoplasmatota archaeon]
MEYVYSAMLLHSAGKEITEEGITEVLETTGVEVDEARVKALTASLEDVDIEEAIEEGFAMPSGGGAAPEPTETEEEEVEEEEEEEEEEERDEEQEKEEAAEGLGSLF